MANFFSTLLAKLPRLGNPGDVYFATDTRDLFIAIPGGDLILLTNLWSGNSQVGPPGPAGPQGPPGSGSNAVEIQNVPVEATPPTDGQLLVFNAETGTWDPGDPTVQGLCR